MEPLIVSETTNTDENDRIEEHMDQSRIIIDIDGGGGRNSVDEDDPWYRTIDQIQRIALLAAPIVAGLALMVVGVWIFQLGGLATAQGKAKLVFSWHPLLMILSFLFMTVATLSFRLARVVGGGAFPPLSRPVAKWGHGLCWAIAVGCMILGLIAVFRSHNDPVSGFIANLYSLHSWIGITVVILYGCQFVVGISAFGGIPISFLRFSPTTKFRLLQLHTWVGPILYQGVILTILLGIQEKEGFVGCSYKVDQADLRPWQHFGEIPSACRISHGLGLLVVLTGVLTLLATHTFERTDRRQR